MPDAPCLTVFETWALSSEPTRHSPPFSSASSHRGVAHLPRIQNSSHASNRNQGGHTMGLEETHTITPIDKVIYTAKAHTTGGRDGGASRTSDGRLEVKLSIPGTPGTGTNPEQLFAVGWSACFLSAMKIVAARKRVKLP